MFHAQEEDAKKIYRRHTRDLFLRGTFLLALWFVFVYCTKFCETMQEPFHYMFF